MTHSASESTATRRDLARRLLGREATYGSAGQPAGQPVGQPAAPAPRSFTSVADAVLARATFGADDASRAEMDELGVEKWLEQQFEADSIDDAAAEALVEAAIEPWRNNAADIRMLGRAIHSRRQLKWRLVYFLNNHFATYRGATAGISESREDDTFAELCFGTFAGALRASAASPAMIDFLDSQSNVAGNPNENYARELMELHTLGVGGGYTEADVAEVARVFTGWSRRNTNTGVGTPVIHSEFWFRAARHDTGPKSLSLGWATPGLSGQSGLLEGVTLLDFLAAHPSTALFVTQKLCRYFVADQPPPGLLGRVHQAFVGSGGDLRTTVQAIFTDAEFATAARTKVHDGFEFVVQAVRRLAIPATNLNALNNRVGLLRAQPHQNPVPTGYPEVGPAWQGVGNVLPRWAFADDLVHNRINGSQVPWAALFGAAPPSGGAAWTDAILGVLGLDDVPATTRLALTVFLDGRLAALPNPPTFNQVLPHVRDLASLALRLPEAHLQ